jgi:hypothetical protein
VYIQPPPPHAAIQHLVLLDRVPWSMGKTLLLRTTPKPIWEKGDRASKGTTDQTPSSADECVGTDVSQVINMNTTPPSRRPEAPGCTPHIKPTFLVNREIRPYTPTTWLTTIGWCRGAPGLPKCEFRQEYFDTYHTYHTYT